MRLGRMGDGEYPPSETEADAAFLARHPAIAKRRNNTAKAANSLVPELRGEGEQDWFISGANLIKNLRRKVRGGVEKGRTRVLKKLNRYGCPPKRR